MTEALKKGIHKAYTSEPLNGELKRIKYAESKYPRSDYFQTKEEALEDFKKQREMAIIKFKDITEKLKKLQDELQFDISYLIDGDTYGIDKDYQYISIKIGRDQFTWILDR